MGVPESQSTSPHLYRQALQIKLYQAFIFSIPILFSIILFLLFYLFYLKRRASSLMSPRQIILRTTPSHASHYVSSPCPLDVNKAKFLDKLPKILFDDESRARDSQCCVCLGEFEMKEELLQIPYCKHIFHMDCIHHWLQSNSTCPLCRCSIIPTTKILNPAPTTVLEPVVLQQANITSNPSSHMHGVLPLEQQEPETSVTSNAIMIPMEGSSIVTSSRDWAPNQESVVLIQTHTS
ncbi:putative Ring finger protein [Quillaja saponaria]|uniref:RING-type E3 ubiquitin transferase n=1 Tax=Quillaja saponaria TaxID=32244 RepID=A0AAD7KU95_QUISA|nr:putative Ring finger protein [Quillaja saponaria]